MVLALILAVTPVGPIEPVALEPVFEAILNAPNNSTVELHIDSPGGSVALGLDLIEAMETAREERGVRFRCTVGDLAASMAVFVLATCDQRIGQLTTRVLIHPVWTTVSGNAAQLREEARRLDFVTRVLLGILALRTRLSLEKYWEKAGARDWWLTCGEAREIGLINECQPILVPGA